MRLTSMILLLFVSLSVGACEIGDDGTFEGGTFYIDVEITPNPPEIGEHTIIATVTTADGAPVNDASIATTVEMPIQNLIQEVEPAVTNLGSGQYQIHPIVFDAAGVWEVTIVAERGMEDGYWLKEYTVSQ